ncbi:MAG TPA: nickel-dependent lactate racemase, partial [Candidatus Hodarchaeales archaeon]|nr:nickel-dependent lactate racemase [Candidatus Hodarchaeales archaeon]
MTKRSYLEIPYGRQTEKVVFPQRVKISVCIPASQKPGDCLDLSKQSWIIPGSQNLEDFLNDISGKRLLIIVNDASRYTPTSSVLESVWPLLQKKAVEPIFLVATGAHRACTSKELETIFGSLYESVRSRIIIHDSREERDLLYLGRTPIFQVDLFINRHLANPDYAGILTINSVEPHYFAGYTGGRKSIVPGVTGHTTITQTHKLALSSQSQICVLEGNPVSDSLEECLNLFQKSFPLPIYSIQLVIDSKGCCQGIFCGDIFESHRKAAKQANSLFVVPVEKKFDLVILAPSSPFDKTLYQSHKAIENARGILKEGSTVVLVAKCDEGIGPIDFMEPFMKWKDLRSNPQKFLERARQEYKLGYHKAAKLVELSQRVNLVSRTSLNKNHLDELGIGSIEDLQGWINQYFSENLTVED